MGEGEGVYGELERTQVGKNGRATASFSLPTSLQRKLQKPSFRAASSAHASIRLM